jgi:predicted metal-binding membrane protein
MIPIISADSIAGYFFVFWIGLAILFYSLIWCDRDAAFKRKWLPRSFIFQGVVFAAFVIFQMTHDPKWRFPPALSFSLLWSLP